jgi:hypothetical protein
MDQKNGDPKDDGLDCREDGLHQEADLKRNQDPDSHRPEGESVLLKGNNIQETLRLEHGAFNYDRKHSLCVELDLRF